MRPRERRDSGQDDLFKARLDQIVDTDHALAKLARAIDWRFLEKRFGAAYSDKTGHPPLRETVVAFRGPGTESGHCKPQGRAPNWARRQRQ